MVDTAGLDRCYRIYGPESFADVAPAGAGAGGVADVPPGSDVELLEALSLEGATAGAPDSDPEPSDPEPSDPGVLSDPELPSDPESAADTFALPPGRLSVL